MTVNDSRSSILANQVVYVDSNQQYLNRQGQTGGVGDGVVQPAHVGSYLFASGLRRIALLLGAM
ncbi:MAG: hypothetical protein R2856_27060 [Caldilineaceae bacterium]